MNARDFAIIAFVLAQGLCALIPTVTYAQTWLWAWDRSEDLRILPKDQGVAYFAAQLDVRGDQITTTARRAVLHARPDTPLLPVLHIEAFHPRNPPELGPNAVAHWAGELAKVIVRLHAPSVQIDFEARAGQRLFYHDVLQALRAKLPPNTRLSITALASWCGEPAWLISLPVDEVVPMYFRMGPRERELWRWRMLRAESLPPVCRSAAGIATDEWQNFASQVSAEQLEALKTRDLYVFSPKSWDATRLAAWLAMMQSAANTASNQSN